MFYIWEAAVTDFYGVPVEDFAQFVVLGEVLVDQGEEDFGDIGGYIAVEGRIKPCDFAFSFFLFSLHFLVGSVSNCRFGLYPLFFRASMYGGIIYIICVSLSATFHRYSKKHCLSQFTKRETSIVVQIIDRYLFCPVYIKLLGKHISRHMNIHFAKHHLFHTNQSGSLNTLVKLP